MTIKTGLIFNIDCVLNRKSLALMVSILLFSNLGTVRAEATNSDPGKNGDHTPTAQIKSTVDRAIRILSDPGLQEDSQKDLRYRLAREVIMPRFDFNEIAKRSLGSHWRRLNTEERSRFVRVFTRFLEQTYVAKITSFNGERFLYAGERVDRDFAEVVSNVISSDGKRVTVGYKLRLVAHDWKIYDLVVENISMVNSYRAQFARIIAQSSYRELVARLEKKLAE